MRIYVCQSGFDGLIVCIRCKKNLPEGRYKLGSSPSVNKPILEHVVEFVSKQK